MKRLKHTTIKLKPFIISCIETLLYGFVPLRIHNVIKTYKCYFGQERSPSIRDCYRCGLGLTTVGIGVNGEIFGCQEHSTYSDLENDLFYIGTIYDGIDPERHIHLLEEFCKNCSSDSRRAG